MLKASEVVKVILFGTYTSGFTERFPTKLFDRKPIRSLQQTPRNNGPIERLISLDAYRNQKTGATSANVALSRLEELRPSLPANFLQDHRLAFLAASEHHDARALCLLLNRRAVPAALHHVSSLIFRMYAQSDAISRLRFIHAHLRDAAGEHTVHINTTIFFRSIIESFYREQSKEVQGEAGRFNVVDDAAMIIKLFHTLGYEGRYNAILETYNASLSRSDDRDSKIVERQNAPTANR